MSGNLYFVIFEIHKSICKSKKNKLIILVLLPSNTIGLTISAHRTWGRSVPPGFKKQLHFFTE